jgi:hypothetical protein
MVPPAQLSGSLGRELPLQNKAVVLEEARRIQYVEIKRQSAFFPFITDPCMTL